MALSRIVVSKAAVYVLEKSGYVKVLARAAEQSQRVGDLGNPNLREPVVSGAIPDKLSP